MRTIFFFCLVFPAALWAEPAAQQALNGHQGLWKGELFYLDYQSGQRFGIPMEVKAEVTEDGATLIRRITYTDPGNLVYAVNLMTIEENGDLVEAFFRDNNAEMKRHAIESAEYQSDTAWRIVYTQDGVDGDRPAKIRQTVERKGKSLTGTKEVRFLDDDSEEFFLRNGTELVLVD